MVAPVVVAGTAVWAAAVRLQRQHLPVVAAAARVLAAVAVPGAAVTKAKSDESESGVPGGKAGAPADIGPNGALPMNPLRRASARMPLAM